MARVAAAAAIAENEYWMILMLQILEIKNHFKAGFSQMYANFALSMRSVEIIKFYCHFKWNSVLKMSTPLSQTNKWTNEQANRFSEPVHLLWPHRNICCNKENTKISRMNVCINLLEFLIECLVQFIMELIRFSIYYYYFSHHAHIYPFSTDAGNNGDNETL